MPNKCIIKSCGATQRRDPLIKFFSFVRNIERRAQWIAAIEKGTGELLDEMSIDINDRVCSLHFQANDILTESKERGDFKILKKDAIPSVFFGNKCRLCLKVKADQKTINDLLDESSQISVMDAIQTTFAINLADSIFSPQRICSHCNNLVKTSFDFKNRIVESNAILREIPHESNQKDLCDFIPPAMIKVEEEIDPFKSKRRKAKFEIKKELSDEEEAVNMLEVQLTEVEDQKPIRTRRKIKSKTKVKDPKKIENRTCKKCKFTADSVLELLKHVDDSKIGCSDCYEPIYECYICRKKFMLDVKKREHVRRDHVEYASKDCPHCIRARLKTATAYELHVRQHFAQPDFLCTNCGKGFFKKELYDLHMRTHDDNFWLYCDHCCYKSKAKCLMTTHLKHHFGIRPFVCDKCSKSFHKSNALNQHIFQVHKTTNKGAYKCPKCEYCFLHRRDIIRHNVYCEGQSKNPINCPRVRFTELDPNCVIKELLVDESHMQTT